MEEYGVTDKGFNLKRFDVLYKELTDELSDELGFDVSQNPQSFLNSALILPFLNIIESLWELGQDIYYSHYPSTATGLSLDNAVQFGSVFREGNKASEYIIACTGLDGSTVPKNSIIASITNPVVNLKCIDDTQITRNACNVIAIKPVLATAGNYVIELSGVMYTYTATSTDTIDSIIDGLITAFTASGYTVTKGEDCLIISDNNLSKSNDFELSSNLTTKYVTSLVRYNTVDYGDINCPIGSITDIVTNVTGLQGVTNNIEYTAGQLQESDYQLRQAYIKKGYTISSKQTESLESYLLTLDNVLSARCYENTKDTTDEYNRPPHSIEVIVQGGEINDIATAILAKKTGGISTYGNISTEVVGTYGDKITINFSRPEEVNIWLRVEIETDGGNITTDYVELIKNSFIEEAEKLTIGDMFMNQLYIDNVYNEIDGCVHCNVLVGTGSTQPSTYKDENVTITQRQLAVLDADRIEVTLV